MSGLQHLETLARGDRPENGGLLGTAKLSWSRVDRLSEEDILAVFAHDPFNVGKVALMIETETGAAIVSDSTALLADLYGGRIGRVWRIGDEVEEEHEPVLHVAFDTDMDQGRSAAVHFRPEDHPDLSAHWREKVLGQIEELIADQRRAGALRTRAFVIRAWGNEAGAVALVSLFSLSSTSQRSANMAYAVVASDCDGRKFAVIAKTSAGDWTPRL
ncbi:MAG: hypothetical protein WA918_11690 [Erythrobacter sp.]